MITMICFQKLCRTFTWKMGLTSPRRSRKTRRELVFHRERSILSLQHQAQWLFRWHPRTELENEKTKTQAKSVTFPQSTLRRIKSTLSRPPRDRLGTDPTSQSKQSSRSPSKSSKKSTSQSPHSQSITSTSLWTDHSFNLAETWQIFKAKVWLSIDLRKNWRSMMMSWWISTQHLSESATHSWSQTILIAMGLHRTLQRNL